MAGQFADDAGRNVRWKRPALHSPTLTPFQSRSLMQRVQEVLGYRHVCGNSCHCWAGASAWHLLVTSWAGLASRQRPLTECWMKEAFLFHLWGERQSKKIMIKINNKKIMTKNDHNCTIISHVCMWPWIYLGHTRLI